MEQNLEIEWNTAGSSEIIIKTEPLFQSDSDGHSDQDSLEPKRRKRTSISWVFVKMFDNAKAAQIELDKENIWSINYTNESEEGKKTYYRCNQVKKRGPQCPAKRYVLYDSYSDAVFLYRTEDDHDHSSKPSSDRGISDAVKAEVNKLLALHLTPKSIMNALAKIKGLTLPKMSQLRNYISERRRGLICNVSTISLGEIKLWLEENSAIPEDPYEAFVTAYEISQDSATFRFVLSSKYLLEIAQNVDILHADTNNKLTWQGNPITVVGATDKQRKFHALCLAVSSTKEKEDFKLFFCSLKNNVQFLFASAFKPTILITDSDVIQNAFIEEFEESNIRTCFSTVRKDIQAKLENFVNEDRRNEILSDLDILHSITNQDAFGVATEYFLEKYANERGFIDYFNDQWVSRNPNWYLGSSPPSPATNDALKAFSKALKDGNTIRERLQFASFVAAIKETVKGWSTKYIQNPDENYFATSPTITLKDWTESYKWAKTQKDFVITPIVNENLIKYKVLADENKERGQNAKLPENFDEFKDHFFNEFDVLLPTDKEKWSEGSCTCPNFNKMYVCKHVIGLSISLGYVVPPVEAINSLGQKRKKPPKANSTLNI